MNEKAVTFTAREKAELLPVEADTGEVGPSEVAGRTLATVVSAGTEINSGYLGEDFPRRSGYASVFTAEKVGEGVEGIEVGDTVFAPGGHVSYQRHPSFQCIRVPAGLAPETAVFARMMGVSMTTLTTTAARPPGTVLVTGLGLVGHLASKNFAACGYEVHACDPVESRRRVAAETGIENVYEAVPGEGTELAGEFQLAIECSGHEQALLDAARVMAKRGEIVCVATPWRKFTDIALHDLHRLIFFNYLVIRSGWEWELPLQPEDFRINSIRENISGALGWLAEGRVRVDGVFSVYEPDRCQEAFQDLLHKRTDRLAAVFDWRC